MEEGHETSSPHTEALPLFSSTYPDVYRPLQTKVLTWITLLCKRGNVQTPQVPEDEFLRSLQSGVILCKLVNILQPNATVNPSESSHVFASLENLAYFVRATENFGVPRNRLFRPMEIVSGQRWDLLIRAVASLAVLCAEFGYDLVNLDVNETRATLDQWDAIIAQQQDILDKGSVAKDMISSRNVPDAESFRKLEVKVGLCEANQKFNMTTLQNRLDKLELDHRTNESKIDGLTAGLIDIIDRLNSRLSEVESINRQLLARSGLSISCGGIQGMSATSGARSSISTTVTEDDESGACESNSTQVGRPVEAGSDSSGGNESPSAPSKSCLPASPMSSGQPKSLVPPEVLAMDLPKKETMRQTIIYELIQTESDYVRDLNVMINYHLADIRKSKILTEEETKTMFSNVETLTAINKRFLDLLNEKKTGGVIERIGDSFAQLAEIASPYTEYCGNYPSALQLYRRLQAKDSYKHHFERWQNHPECRGLSLESFLIKPVQRLCKYPLLLKELIKNTAIENDDHTTLQFAQLNIEEVVKVVNEGTRQLNDKEKIMAFQAKLVDAPATLNLVNKRLIRDGVLQKVSGSKTKERYVILFHDLLLICRSSMQMMSKAKYQLEFQLRPDKVIVKGDVEVDKGPLHCFELIIVGSKKESIVFACSNDEEKTKWTSSIAETNRKYIEQRQRDSDSLLPVENFVEDPKTNAIGTRPQRQKSGEHTTTMRHSTLVGDSTENPLSRKYSTLNRKQLNLMRKAQEAQNIHLNTSSLRLDDFPSNTDFVVTAVADFVPLHPNQLGFSAGAQIRVINKDNTDVWKVEIKNAFGFIPSALVSSVEDNDTTGHPDYSKYQGEANTASIFSDQSSMHSDSGDSYEEYDDPSPELVEIEGKLWKRAETSTGQEYYYKLETKETCWSLPPNYIIIDPVTGEKFVTYEETGIDDDGEHVVTEKVEEIPDWFKVDIGDGPAYYFNTLTGETSWKLPELSRENRAVTPHQETER